MSRLKITLSIFAITAFIALGLGVSQAQAGLVGCSTANCCQGYNCDIVCSSLTGGRCDGTDGQTGGTDVFCGSKLADTINASGGDDLICGGFGDDIINGEYGDDDIYSGWGQDDIDGGSGEDYIEAGRCGDIVDGGYDDDVCYGGRGTEGAMTSCESPIAGGDIGLEDGDNANQCNFTDPV